MSYCRFAWDGSDVYVFEHCDGGIECCWCALFGTFNAPTPEEMIQHLVEHKKAGHFVPPYAIEGLWWDVAGPNEPVHPEPEAMTKAKEMMKDA